MPKPRLPWVPDVRLLREAREKFSTLLTRPNTKESLWQKFFAEHPYVLSAALPIKLMPQDLVPLGRQGRSEPDLIFYPRHTPRLHSSYGVIELKRSDHRILTHPRKNVMTLSANAATAVAQGFKYLSDLEQGSILQPRESHLFLGTSAYVFIVMGLSVELEQAMVSGLLNASSEALLPPNFQIIPYDLLYEMFHASVPPIVMVAVPEVMVAVSKSGANNDVMPKLGIVVSAAAEQNDFRNFVSMHWQILSRYPLLVSESTAVTLDTVGRELKSSEGVEPQWDLQVFRNSRELQNKLVMAHREEVGRVLLFLDRDNLKGEMDEFLQLRLALAEHHQELYINREAEAWAEGKKDFLM